MRFFCIYCEKETDVKNKEGMYTHRTRCKSKVTCYDCGKRIQKRNMKKHTEENCQAKFGNVRKKRKIYSLEYKLKTALEFEIWKHDKHPEKLFLKRKDIDRRQLKGISIAKFRFRN
jgi:hypothetical protein